MEINFSSYSKKLKRKTVLDNINATLKSGSIYGLYGQNGSGKSMLMRAISGLIRPTTGAVTVDGRKIGVEIDFPDSMGLIIENIEMQAGFDARTNLQILRDIKKIATDSDIDWALEQVGLDPKSNLKVRNFSLGMRQKLAIAQAIFEKPKLLLLDEPTNALDFKTVVAFRELIKKMQQPDRIIVIASHNRDDLESVADKFLEMDAGQLFVRSNREFISGY